jgi:hypothetical protein
MRLPQSRLSAMFALLLGAAMTGTAWGQYLGDAFELGEGAPPPAGGAQRERLFPQRRGLLRSGGRRFLSRREAGAAGFGSFSPGVTASGETRTETPRPGVRLWARSLAAMRRRRQAARARQEEPVDETPTIVVPPRPSQVEPAYFGPQRSVLDSSEDRGVVIEMGTPEQGKAVGTGIGPTLAPPRPPGAAPEEVPNFDVRINIPRQ